MFSWQADSVLHVRVIEGVPAYVAREAQRFAAKVAHVVRIEHPLMVEVVPAEVLTDGHKGYGFGLFYFDKLSIPSIALAGDLRSIVTECGKSEALGHLRQTFAHELAHYEQWRDGRKVQERGVEVRARNIVRLCDLIR